MAWHYLETTSLNPTGFNSKDPANLTDYQKDNIQEIVNKLTGYGYTLNAISGILANMLAESYLNPAQYQSNFNFQKDIGGYGLVQWTNTNNVHNLSIMRQWFNSNGYSITDGDKQLEFLNGMNAYITGTWFKSPRFPQYYLPWEQYKKSTESPAWLTRVFFESFERGTWINRDNLANGLFNYISGITPTPTPPTPTPPSPEIFVRKKFPIYFYLKPR